MNRQQIRKLAIALLMDDYGINQIAWDFLWDQLVDHDCTDITACVENDGFRYFLPVGWKEEAPINRNINSHWWLDSRHEKEES